MAASRCEYSRKDKEKNPITLLPHTPPSIPKPRRRHPFHLFEHGNKGAGVGEAHLLSDIGHRIGVGQQEQLCLAHGDTEQICPDHRIAPDAEWDNVRYYCQQMRLHFL